MRTSAAMQKYVGNVMGRRASPNAVCQGVRPALTGWQSLTAIREPDTIRSFSADQGAP
jgi:hypothetical protein